MKKLSPLSLVAGIGICASSCIVQTEQVDCEVGSAVICAYAGPPDTEGRGLCHAGIKTCIADGAYGECEGEALPATEDCTTPFDDNCDGQVNEACACVPYSAALCYAGLPATKDLGVCRGGIQVCNAEGTSYGECDGEVLPGVEDCATPDDENCDGEVNEEAAGCGCVPGAAAVCYTGPRDTEGVGPCKPGTRVCNADGKTWGSCAGEIVPAPEDCATAKDDDCNGQVNEPAAGCVCVPDTTVNCPYAGPPETEGIGICAVGNHTCNSQGTDYLSLCSGEVVPSFEVCGSLADENCDGDVACHGYYVWAAGVGDSNDQYATHLAVDSDNNVFVSGVFKGQLDFGGTALNSAGGYDIFLTKIDPQGKHLWSKKYGDAQDQGDLSLAVDASGNLLVAGRFEGTIDFDPPCFTLVTQGSSDIVVAKLQPDGTCVWSKRFGGAASDGADGIVVDGAGNIVLSAFFGGSVDFGGGPLTTAAVGGEDIAVVKLKADGSHVWSKSFGSLTGASQRAYRIAVDGSDNILLTGQLAGAVNYGGGALSSAGNNDVFIVKLGSLGNHLWSKRFGDSADQFGVGVAADSSGDVFVTGYFGGSADFGGGSLSSAGLYDIFIAAFAPAGSPLWSKRFGGPAQDYAHRIDVDNADNVVVTGEFSGAIDFGGGSLTNIGSSDAYAAKFDVLGKPLWNRTFGALTAQQESRAVATDGLGNVFVAGGFLTAADFGAGLVSSEGSRDVFIVKLSP